MAELTQGERLQPSLLDRLTDDDPTNPTESRDRRVLSVDQLRKSVLRDLEWLLNTDNMTSAADLDEFPEVKASVLNYGLPPLAGLTSSSIESNALEKILRQAIRDFEPRILPQSVKVRVVVDEQEMGHNALTFAIDGELWAQPLPLHLYLRTEIDLESGHAAVSDAERSR